MCDLLFVAAGDCRLMHENASDNGICAVACAPRFFLHTVMAHDRQREAKTPLEVAGI